MTRELYLFKDDVFFTFRCTGIAGVVISPRIQVPDIRLQLLACAISRVLMSSTPDLQPQGVVDLQHPTTSVSIQVGGYVCTGEFNYLTTHKNV